VTGNIDKYLKKFVELVGTALSLRTHSEVPCSNLGKAAVIKMFFVVFPATPGEYWDIICIRLQLNRFKSFLNELNSYPAHSLTTLPIEP
jgi:hypothetical protein